MGLLDLFFSNKKTTAGTAKARLEILIRQERIGREAPDYLPMLQKELLDVIRKYVKVDLDEEAVQVDMKRDGNHGVLGISVQLPDERPASA
ncbi:MAG TPA: cell division topological specificity factor MinE [Lysobacter sp.]|jgi:cell division topological specificity factor